MNCCRNCKNKYLTKIINIGNQPLSGIFYRKKKTNLKSFSLDLYKCKKCELIQLGKSAPTEEMYGSHYGYRTSLSKLMVNHIKNKFLSLKKNIKKNDMILDIGSNDGTFLNFFSNLKKNFTLIGTDPSANKFRNYYNKDIHLIVDFFSQKKIDNYIKYKNIKKKFSLITSFAMFYDIEDPNYFCKEIYNLLKKDGLWCLEMSYLPLLLENLTYDQICHEHVTYYTLSVFKKIAEKNNLKVIDISFNEINGGSIEIICARKESYHRICAEKIEKILKKEKEITFNSYKNLEIRINVAKKNILEFLQLIKKSRKNILGYGASTKGNVVLNHFGINNSLLPAIADGNPEKNNLYTPGTNIKIIKKEKMREIKPDYLFVLIWSFRKEVIKQETKYLKQGGKLIFHLPQFHIVDKNNYKKFIKYSFNPFAFSI